MAARDGKLAIGMLLPAMLLLAAAMVPGTAGIDHAPELPPEVAGAPLEAAPLPALPDDPEIDDRCCEITVDATDRNREALLRDLARHADVDRDESSVNRVSNRELVVRIAPDTPWSAVRPILLAAVDPAVRIHRISIAGPGDEPVPLLMNPKWLPTTAGEKQTVPPEPRVTVELMRRLDETETRLEILDWSCGRGDQAVRPLRHKAILLRGNPEVRRVPARVFAWDGVPAREVVRAARLLRDLGFPGVELLCLTPGEGEAADRLCPREAAARLCGKERMFFLLEALWADTGFVRSGAASVIPELGDEVIPYLLDGVASPSPRIREIAVRTLGGFEAMSTNVREALLRVTERDPSPDVRHAAKLALGIVQETEV